MKTILLKENDDINTYISTIDETTYEILDAGGRIDTTHFNVNQIHLIGKEDRERIFRTVSSKVAEHIDWFEATTAGERQIHYRDYTKSKEKQMDMAWLINIAPDVKCCWNILMKVLEEPNYIVIWWDDKNKKYDNARNFQALSKYQD